MWSRITTWLRARWPWVTAVLAGLLAIVGLTRRRQATTPAAPVPLGGLTHDQAEAEKDKAWTEHDREVAAAGRDLEAELAAHQAARERKKKQGGRARVEVVLLFLLGSLGSVALISCRATPRPDPGPAPVADAELERLCAECQQACEAIPGDEGCACADDCSWAKHAARVARADAKACRAVAAADAGELTRRLQEALAATQAAQAEAEDLRTERWWWGLVGVGAGAILTGLLVGLLGG